MRDSWRNSSLEAQRRAKCLHYTLEGKQVQNVKVMGRDKKSTRTNTTNLTWTVKSVSANGDAEIALRFDRVRMRIEQPPFMPLEFDSSPNKLEIPDEFESAERQIKALAGAEFTFTLRPTGEVDDLKIPAANLEESPRRRSRRSGRSRRWSPNRA